MRLWKDIKALSESSGAQIYGNRCGWWNSGLSTEFLDYHFASRDSYEPVMLLWDDVLAHWTEEVVQYTEDRDVFLLKVSPGLTSVCHPTDVSWFGHLKRRIRGDWAHFLIQQLKDHE